MERGQTGSRISDTLGKADRDCDVVVDIDPDSPSPHRRGSHALITSRLLCASESPERPTTTTTFVVFRHVLERTPARIPGYPAVRGGEGNGVYRGLDAAGRILEFPRAAGAVGLSGVSGAKREPSKKPEPR